MYLSNIHDLKQDCDADQRLVQAERTWWKNQVMAVWLLTQRDASRGFVKRIRNRLSGRQTTIWSRWRSCRIDVWWLTNITLRDASENPKSEPRLWTLAEAVRFWKMVYSKYCARKWSALERPTNGLSGSELIGCYIRLTKSWSPATNKWMQQNNHRLVWDRVVATARTK